MSKVIIGLGSNLGEREQILNEAILLIAGSAGTIISISSFYESEPWGFESVNWFLNGALSVDTHFNPTELLEYLHKLEHTAGRKRTLHYSDRTLDADILLWDDPAYGLQDGASGGPVIPHPRLHLRRFVLVPLAEIAPEWRHPSLRLSVTELLDACQDRSEVRLFRKPHGIH